MSRAKEGPGVDTIELGDVSITRVFYWQGPVAPMDVMVPNSTPQLLEDNRRLLAPDFWEPETSSYIVAVQSWVIRSQGRVIVVDTGAGDGKPRPNMPPFNELSTGYPATLEAAGVAPDEVDLVVNTHLHVDHVGGNTVRVGEAWVPLFPRAKYLLSRIDVEFWRPGAPVQPVGVGVNVNVFEDSVQPVLDADQALLWDDSYQIDSALRIELAPGHTPGHAIVKLESAGESAALVGDLLHSPLQVEHSDFHSCFCEDPQEAQQSRERLLGWAADTGALVVPAHFSGHGAFKVTRIGGRFAIAGWAPFDRQSPAQ